MANIKFALVWGGRGAAGSGLAAAEGRAARGHNGFAAPEGGHFVAVAILCHTDI